MRVKQTFWMIVLSVISVQSISSAPVPSFAEVQTKRIANPSIEVRDAQSLTSRTADVTGKIQVQFVLDDYSVNMPLDIRSIKNGLYLYSFKVSNGKVFYGKLIVD